jgi:hypothetical protein
MPSDLQTILQLVPERHEMDGDSLSNHIRDNFSGSLLSLKQLEPFVSEILRRFKRLPRKKSVDGTYSTISGYRSFGAGKIDNVGWCQGVLHRSDRTVRYMLKGGNKKRKEPKTQVESVSVLDAAALLKYLDRHIGDLDSTQQKLLVEELAKTVARLEKSIEHAPEPRERNF